MTTRGHFGKQIRPTSLEHRLIRKHVRSVCPLRNARSEVTPCLVLGMVLEMTRGMISGLTPGVVEIPGVAPGKEPWRGSCRLHRQALDASPSPPTLPPPSPPTQAPKTTHKPTSQPFTTHPPTYHPPTLPRIAHVQTTLNPNQNHNYTTLGVGPAECAERLN